MGKTKIEWATKTWNIIEGCSKVSPGCGNCYAERWVKRFAGRPDKLGKILEPLIENGRWTGRTVLVDYRMDEPKRWKTPQRVFVCSRSDLFHENTPDSDIDRVFDVMEECSLHTFLILTKRPDRMCDYMNARYRGTMAPKNIWAGVSVEDQLSANNRMKYLAMTPAVTKFVSCEPLLGPIDIEGWMSQEEINRRMVSGTPVSWVIVGGESGPYARPMHPWWAEILRDQCRRNGVPFNFKQWGEWGYSPDEPEIFLGDDGRFYESTYQINLWPCSRLGKKNTGRELDGVVYDEYPDD